MRSVTALCFETQPVAQALAVTSPGLDHLADKLVEQGSLTSNQAGVEKAGRPRCRSAGIHDAFSERAHARLDMDSLFPQRIADGLGHRWHVELSCVQEQRVGVGLGCELAPTVGVERDHCERASQWTGEVGEI